MLQNADSAGWHDRRHRSSTLADYPLVFPVEKDPEPEDAAAIRGETPVTEVEAQQVGIIGRRERAQVVFGVSTCWAAVLSGNARTERPPAGHFSVPPVTNRPPRNPGLASDLAVVESTLD